MTTIAYKDGIIAYDSRATAENVIYNDSSCKRVKENGADFFLCGAIDGHEALINWFFDPSIKPSGYDGQAFVCHSPGVVWCTGLDEGKFCRWRVDVPWAIGSGANFALGAMRAGANALEAVKIAAQCDPYTGGKIRTYKVK